MADPTREERLFSPDKLEWMLAGGLEAMAGGERQILLVMAETKIQEGYKPTSEEKKVMTKLRALAGDDYDAKDIQRKVKTMVKGRKKAGTAPLNLPSTFDRLIGRFRSAQKDAKNESD
jgi:hypothetical protein